MELLLVQQMDVIGSWYFSYIVLYVMNCWYSILQYSKCTVQYQSIIQRLQVVVALLRSIYRWCMCKKALPFLLYARTIPSFLNGLRVSMYGVVCFGVECVCVCVCVCVRASARARGFETERIGSDNQI
jgi:hypothetical protein